MIEFKSVTAGGFHGASFVLEPGTSCRLLLASQSDLALFLELLIGTARPIDGSVLLFGREITRLPELEALPLLARLGLVWPGGGLVSNLKAWENILLPLWYHGPGDAGKREGETLDLLGRLGLEPERIPAFLGALPGSLPERERRLLGLTRAMMQDAEVMIYAGLFEGMEERTRDLLRLEADRHQVRRPGRASLYVAESTQGLPEPFEGRSLQQDYGGGLTPWP